MTSTPAAKSSSKFTAETFLSTLGWTEKNVGARLNALGLLETCSRCGGSGRFSYCQMYGDRCFKCVGSGKQLPKFTQKLLKTVQKLIAEGALQPYLDLLARRAAAKKALAPLFSEAEAAYKVIGDLYDIAYRTGHPIPRPLFHAQTLNNAIFWSSGSTQNPRSMPVMGLKDAASRGTDPETLVAEMRIRIEWLKQVSDAFLASAAG